MSSDKALLVNEPDFETPEFEYCATVVSLLPFEINEDKPHMLPSTFKVPAASEDGRRLGILHVREGLHYVPNPIVDEGKPGASIRQITPPNEMARSICQDYNSAHVALGEGAGPGLFWVPGKCTQKDVEARYPKQLKAAREMQKNWFHNLAAMADADWEHNHNMLAVSDLQRHAARALGIHKAWVEFKMEEMFKCPFCAVPVTPDAAKCPNCKEIINRAKYDELKKEFDPGSLFSGDKA